jgi:hypothetical protein
MFETIHVSMANPTHEPPTTGLALLPAWGEMGLLLGSAGLRAGSAWMRVRGRWYGVLLGATAGGGAFPFRFV